MSDIGLLDFNFRKSLNTTFQFLLGSRPAHTKTKIYCYGDL